MYKVQVRYPDPNQTRRQGWHDVEGAHFNLKPQAEAHAQDLKNFMGKDAEYRVRKA